MITARLPRLLVEAAVEMASTQWHSGPVAELLLVLKECLLAPGSQQHCCVECNCEGDDSAGVCCCLECNKPALDVDERLAIAAQNALKDQTRIREMEEDQALALEMRLAEREEHLAARRTLATALAQSSVRVRELEGDLEKECVWLNLKYKEIAELGGEVEEMNARRERVNECRRKDRDVIMDLRLRFKAVTKERDELLPLRTWRGRDVFEVIPDLQQQLKVMTEDRDEYREKWQYSCQRIDKLKREIELGKQWAVHPLEVRATMLTGADSTLEPDVLESFRYVIDQVRGMRT